VLLVVILVVLGVAVRGTPSPVSWLIHFLFACALTLLIYRNLLNRSHSKQLIAAMTMLMILWEIFEWFVQGTRVSDSVPLTGVDTTLDLVCGFAGVVVAIRVSKSFGWM
jgi:branched-subunit amino acid ABC-type transport system permease component